MNKPLNIAALFPPRPTPQFPTSYDPTFDGVPYNLEVNCEPVNFCDTCSTNSEQA